MAGNTLLRRAFSISILMLLFTASHQVMAQGNDQQRGMVIYLKGAVITKKGKTENKDYKLFAPTAGIVQMRDNAGNVIPVAVCNGCDVWTTEVVKFINRSRTIVPVKTN